MRGVVVWLVVSVRVGDVVADDVPVLVRVEVWLVVAVVDGDVVSVEVPEVVGVDKEQLVKLPSANERTTKFNVRIVFSQSESSRR